MWYLVSQLICMIQWSMIMRLWFHNPWLWDCQLTSKNLARKAMMNTIILPKNIWLFAELSLKEIKDKITKFNKIVN